MIAVFFLLLGLSIQQNIVEVGRVESFQNAVSITGDGKGNIYVLDNLSNELIKFTPTLKEIKRIGRKGWTAGEFDGPTFVDCSTGLDIYVCDGKNYRIQRFDLNLSYVTMLVTNAEIIDSRFKFDTPLASTILGSNMYVLDGENKRIVVYKTQNYTPFGSFGGFQSAEPSFVQPVKILSDNNMRLYVYDAGRSAIYIYDNFGTYIKYITYSNIKGVSVLNNYLYILTDDEIIEYNLIRNSFESMIKINNSIEKGTVTDILFYSKETDKSYFFVLYKDKLILYKLITP
ncbi:MAG: hypothetical protein ACP5P3_09625 [Ignavibacteria bacterium]